MTNPRFLLNHTGLEILFYAWVGLDMLLLLPIAVLLGAALPIFTIIWLAVPLASVIHNRDVLHTGFRKLSWSSFWRTTATAFAVFALVMLLVEPWAHVYRDLIAHALAANPLDTTFAWIARYPRWLGLLGMVLYTGLISIFAEELFFRGWLLQVLLRRMPLWPAIILQAVAFSLPQALAAFTFTPLQGSLWIIVYAWLGVGVIGGWAAARTGSIWPSLVSATLMNTVLVMIFT